MTNLRIVRSALRSNSSIEITFTANLSSSIGINNVSIESLNGTTADPTVLSTSISNNVFTINTRPFVARAYYKLTLASTITQKIRGAKGEIFVEDGKTNIIFFNGPATENSIRDEIINGLPGIYTKEPGTLVFDSITSGADEMLDSKYFLGQTKSAAYVSLEVIDEQKTRGAGPTDRFDNEGVYKVLRVGSNPTGATAEESFSYDAFPEDPVSLQQLEISENISNSTDAANSFNGLIITVSNRPIIKVLSIVLIQNNIEYVYNINQYRYGLLESKYDSLNSYSFLSINDNQIKLTDSAIGPSFPLPQANDTIRVSYLYKRMGRNVDPESIVISVPVQIIRESAPAVATTFFLNHAPIINSIGNVATSNGVVWLDPAKGFNPAYKHPAFTTELKYNPTNLPKTPGQFSINYETGQVFVFGVDGNGYDGTTVVPPVANYLYDKIYQEGLDYVFYSDDNDIASIPDRELRGNEAIIKFNYEDNFANTVDFNFNSHVEVINERVQNRLIDNIGIKTLYGPVNSVFRIYNETTGELYSTTRIKDNEIYFSSLTAPRINNVIREAVSFEDVSQAQLVITETLSISGNTYFKINLEKQNIMSASGGFIGSSFNSSLNFSNKEIFIHELYYDTTVSVDANLSRLIDIGNYTVDYELGLVYVKVEPDSTTLIGDATYKYGFIKTRNSHVIRVDNIYRSSSVLYPNVENFLFGEINDSSVEVLGLEKIGEYDNDGPILVSALNTVEVSKDVSWIGGVFQITDLKTTIDPINFGFGAVKSNLTTNIIQLSNSGVIIYDNNEIVVQNDGRNYIEVERTRDLFDLGVVELVSVVSVTNIDTGINYFIAGPDGYVDASTNRIYLPTGIGSIGDVVLATYYSRLLPAAAVVVEYSSGGVFIDYTFTPDEIIVSYEYGDNVLDWSISDSLRENKTYYVSYRYGALRDTLRDNFGRLTGIDELSTISDNLDRETYRAAVEGSLQTFPKGPTIPSIKNLVKAFTQIEPNITESAFFEWILGRDLLNLETVKVSSNNIDEIPVYSAGKFDKGIVIDKEGQTLTLPAVSNIAIAEGTWESFIIPNWDGIENDASLTFDILFDGIRNTDKVFIGANGTHPESIPFSINRDDSFTLGKPADLHSENGYFIWYDTSSRKWRIRARAPILENRRFTGNITTTGEFYNVVVAKTADGYDGYESSIQKINEINDIVRSTRERIYFSFVVDGYDALNAIYDGYDAYGSSIAAFDGIDFTSDNLHYLFDTGELNNKCRMSVFKDGQGFIKFRVYDNNGRSRIISANISDWQHSETHHVAISWKLGTVEQKDEMHLFIDGAEVPNTYRFGGYLQPYFGSKYMETATELLEFLSSTPTVGGFDLITTAGSNIVRSTTINFIGFGIVAGSRFIILDDTIDGRETMASPYVCVRSIVDGNTLVLENYDHSDFICSLSLTSVRYSINPLEILTNTNPQVEKVKIFTIDSYGSETELNSPSAIYPDYGFSRDGYEDYINIYNGISVGDSIILKTYGLNMARSKNNIYVWSNMQTNILNAHLPAPTTISKINVTKLIVTNTIIDPGSFALIATDVGGHFIMTLNSNLEFCQPSNNVTGRRLKGIIHGDNFDFLGINKIVFVGETTDGVDYEEIIFTSVGEVSTTKYFTFLTDIISSFTPIEVSSFVGSIEVKETLPLNMQENGGDYAEIRLSVQQANGSDGYAYVGTSIVMDSYARFDADDIGKTFNILSPIEIAGVYTISDVGLDPSGMVKDSNVVYLSGVSWGSNYSGIIWQLINVNYGDSGFANGMITLEKFGSGGLPFLLGRCWYEIDFPTYLTIPWETIPDFIYFGSDNSGRYPADAVIDEVRILNELSLDTGIGEQLPSSGRSITTDYLSVREYSVTPQTLVLLHFDEDVVNYANFYNSFSKAFRQSENSVNSSFGQSAVFNESKSYKVDNKGIFNNNGGTIEFWISPILDTYNDPTQRYYVDLSSISTIEADVLSVTTIQLPVRARSISSVTVSGSNVNYMIGGVLATNGSVAVLGQPLPRGITKVNVVFVPVTSQGDRFSIYKDDNNSLILYVSASGVEYQITAPVYWKKNTWHRVFVEWSLNNADNQDRLVLMVDGTEVGVIRYGMGLLYGAGSLYGQPNIWGSANVGTASSRNILADINLLDTFNIINIGSDYTETYSALSRIDNLRISSEPRSIIYLGGTGPGRLIGKDLLYTSNINVAQPVISDALTKLLLDFDTEQTEVENLSIVRNKERGIFDFYVDVIDSFSLAQTDLIQELITNLINRLKPAHTRAFVRFVK